MDYRLSNVINDYLQAVRTACTLMQKSGISLPYTSGQWFDTDHSRFSTLDGGISFYKHGAGCWVELPDGHVDFDFGREGEISGLDAWKLGNFAEHRNETYDFADTNELVETFNQAVEQKELLPLEFNLYRLANQPVETSSSIDSREEGDLLPHRDADKVLVLNVHYFYAADLMLTQYDALVDKRTKKETVAYDEKLKSKIYMDSWLGFLAVTCEGYKKLNLYRLLHNERPLDFQELLPMANDLSSSLKKHYDHLRKYRNNVFHLRDSVDDTLAFLSRDAGRLAWARSIHAGLKDFFSNYRVCCESHYIMNGRESESSFPR
jgi:hypothetical protein